MDETDYYPTINEHYRENPPEETVVWEAKITKTRRLSFRCLLPHQEEDLLKAEIVFCYKIPDSGVAKKPFDGFAIVKGVPIFIAIYYKPRKTEIYKIHLRDFLKEKYESGNKSLTIERARELSIGTI